MPGFDRTGPVGAGSRTGRGMGNCADDERSDTARRGPGFGRGRGWRHQARATGLPGWMQSSSEPDSLASSDDVGSLTALAQWLQTQLDAIHQRLAELSDK